MVRQLREAGHEVRVIPTESALRFVGAATFEALSGQPVRTGVFDDVPDVPHVRLGQEADLVVVAPATADLLARAVAGRADDLLTATLLTARCRCCSRRRCTPRCGNIRRPSRTWTSCADAVPSFSNPHPGGSPDRIAAQVGCLSRTRSPSLRAAPRARRCAALRPARYQDPGQRRRHSRGAGSGSVHRQPQLG